MKPISDMTSSPTMAKPACRLALILLLSCASAYAISQPQNVASSTHTTGQHEQSAIACYGVGSCFWRWVGDNHDVVIALSTFGLLIVTAALAIYTARLWRETKNLAEDAKTASAAQSVEMQNAIAATNKVADAGELQVWVSRDSAERQLRAYIAITKSDYTQLPEHWAVTFSALNVGQTPAFEVKTFCTIFMDEFPLKVPLLERITCEERESNPTVFPNVEVHGSGKGEKLPSDEERKRFGGRKHALYLFVEIRYKDTFGNDRFTRRCMHSGNVVDDMDFDDLFAYKEGNEAT